MALVVVERGAIFGTGDRHGRAAPRRQHHQRGSFAQPVVQPRQPVDIVHRGAEFRIEEHQDPLECRARHIERAGRTGQRLAAGIFHHLRRRSAPAGSGLADFQRETFGVLGKCRHFQRLIARLARAAGIRAEAFSGVSLRLCRISARSLALAAKNMSLISAASLGRIARLEAIRSSASVGASRGRASAARRQSRRRAAPSGRAGRPQSELVHDLGRRRRIDRKPGPHRRAGGVVDLVDQARSQFDELPFLVGGMRAGWT